MPPFVHYLRVGRRRRRRTNAFKMNSNNTHKHTPNKQEEKRKNERTGKIYSKHVQRLVCVLNKKRSFNYKMQKKRSKTESELHDMHYSTIYEDIH